jgi:hypothetical protein
VIEKKFVWMLTFEDYVDILRSMVVCKQDHHYVQNQFYHIEDLSSAFQDAAESISLSFSVFREYNVVSQTGYNEKHETTLKETPSPVCECEDTSC